jgi:D-alanine-D-alanine ligase-like ATP-grasp enzyme
VPIYIARDGNWYSDKAMNDIAYFKQSNFQEKLKQQKKLQLSFDGGFKIIHPGLIPKTTLIDVVFPAMHGTFGEVCTVRLARYARYVWRGW